MKQLPQVLLVDDNPADVVLARERWPGVNIKATSQCTGWRGGAGLLHRIGQHADALRPDLVILDLNLAQEGRSSGSGGSQSRQDSAHYPSGGVQYLALDPGHRAQLRARRQLLRAQAWNLEDYFLAVQSIEEFWFGSASLPREEK